jgi:hypothetical protein
MALAAPTVNTGDRSTAVGIEQTRRVVDMRDTIYDYDPDATGMLTVMSRRLNSVLAENPSYQHLEDQPLPWWDLIGTTFANATATTFVVTNFSYFRIGDLLFINTSSLSNGEVVKVTGGAGGAGSAITSTTLTIIRNYDGDQVNGGTQAGTPNGSFVSIIGNVNEEMATKRTIKTTQEAVFTNYAGILRDPFGASNTLQASKLYGGKERSRQRTKFATQHNLTVERAFLFSKKSEKTGTNGHKERATGGLNSLIVTNRTNINGTLTDSGLETFCETVFRYGSSTKLLICGRRVSTQLDMIASGRIQTVPRADVYGVAVKEFLSNHGSLLVAVSNTLINDFAGYAFAVDMDHVFKRHMADDKGSREARLNTEIQDPSADGWEDEYLSEVGLHVTNEATHGVMYGIS